MELYDCPSCGTSGWTIYEIKNGECPNCDDLVDDLLDDDMDEYNQEQLTLNNK